MNKISLTVNIATSRAILNFYHSLPVFLAGRKKVLGPIYLQAREWPEIEVEGKEGKWMGNVFSSRLPTVRYPKGDDFTIFGYLSSQKTNDR